MLHKKLLSLLLCLLLCWPATGWAASYAVTETQLQNIEQLANDLDRSIAILSQSSEVSIKQLIEAEKKLATLESLWKESEDRSKKIEQLLENYKIQVANLRLLYEKSEIRNKKLKQENEILKIGLIGAIGYIIVNKAFSH